MDVTALKNSLNQNEPPDGLPPVIQALWYAAKGDWNRAHEITQPLDNSNGAWVHAHLHRVEGDQSNAAYWYRRAGKPVATSPLDAEWNAIAQTLLDELTR